MDGVAGGPGFAGLQARRVPVQGSGSGRNESENHQLELGVTARRPASKSCGLELFARASRNRLKGRLPERGGLSNMTLCKASGRVPGTAIFLTPNLSL